MTTLLILAARALFDCVFGWAVLGFIRKRQEAGAEQFFLSLLIGIYGETLLAGTFLFLGLSLSVSGIAAAVVMLAGIAAALAMKRMRRPVTGFGSPLWFELLALVAIGEKLVFSGWQLLRTHTYFDDALMHWSGRARSLFGGVNWSLDETSPVFLGRQVGTYNYPLLVIMWRALAAKLVGGWNEILSRADGILFLIAIVGIVWITVWRFTKSRWFSAAAAFCVAAIPLNAWHAAAGFSDIAVEAFVVASVCALIEEEALLAGVLAAGAIWSKNDGLVVYVPALAVAAGLMLGRRALLFLAGAATVAPWLLFNLIHHLGFQPPTRGGFQWHPDAPGLLWNAFVLSPSSGVLWIFVAAAIAYSARGMLKDVKGRALLTAFFLILGSICFVFLFTSAYQFLADQTTIHRVLMQFSATAFLIAMYGLWLKIPVKAARKRR
jgi:hypothetical protein